MLKVESQGKTLTKDRENINLQATGTKVFPELFGNGEAGAIRFIPSLIEQLCLLDREDHHRISATDASNATIFSTDVLKNPSWGAVLPQFALLGSASQTEVVPSEPDVDRRLFLNTNIPWSAFICGVQGGGKSHTMSCLIENCLIPTPTLGVLHRPLSALVLYLGQNTSRSSFRPCEAAFLARPSPQFQDQFVTPSVNVLVSPSNVANLKKAYSQIPGVKVQPLRFLPKHLTVSSILAMMSVDQSQSSSLYMAQVVKILRDTAAEATGDFDFEDFKSRLAQFPFTDMQRRPLDQRLELLGSFLNLGNTPSCFDFQSGSMTIVDLSCPFVDANTACVLFNICMGIYLEDSSPEVGRVIAVDEAHKYLSGNSPASKALTERLLGAIRLQRHDGARIIISTQEPTISPRLIDLCSMVFTHRFTSPDWFRVLSKHICTNGGDKGAEELFARIASLRTGEALIFAPQGLVSYTNVEIPSRMNLNLLRVKMRKRLTFDGGRSVTACGFPENQQ